MIALGDFLYILPHLRVGVMIQRDAVRRVLRFFQQRVHGPYPVVVGRRGGGQVVIVPQQAVADEIAAEADIRLGVVEIVEGQILCRGNFVFIQST